MTIVQIRLPLVSTQQISKAAGYVAGQVRRAESRRRMQHCFLTPQVCCLDQDLVQARRDLL